MAVTGNDPGAKTTESLWWLTDAGARFGVDDTRDVREALGLKTSPSLAPWVALRLLPQGPTLSRADALVEHDTLPMDMSPAELAVPEVKRGFARPTPEKAPVIKPENIVLPTPLSIPPPEGKPWWIVVVGVVVIGLLGGMVAMTFASGSHVFGGVGARFSRSS